MNQNQEWPQFDDPKAKQVASSLDTQLRDLARWYGNVEIFRALTLSACAVVAAFFFLAWVDLLAGLIPLARLSGLAVGIALGIFMLFVMFVRLRRNTHLSRIAKRVDAMSSSGGQVRVGLDLAQSTQKDPIQKGLSTLAVGKASVIAGDIAPEEFAPFNHAGRAWMGLLSLCGVIFILWIFFPDAAGTEWARLTDPFGDHPPYSRLKFEVKPGDTEVVYGDALDVTASTRGGLVQELDLVVLRADGIEETLPMFEDRELAWKAQLTGITEPIQYCVRTNRARSRFFKAGIITTPRIEDVRVTITPPPYTNLPPSEGGIPREGITGVRGTQVKLSVASNRPLSGGKLTLKLADEEPVPVESTAVPGLPNAVEFTFPIQKSGSLALNVRDVEGQKAPADVTATIVMRKDSRPFVRFISPKAESYATPDAVLAVQLEAEDDFGIQSLSLYRSLNSSRPLATPIELEEKNPRQCQASTLLSLSQYGLAPGDVITMFGRVTDTDPDPKGAESPLVSVTIISQEDFDQIVRQQAGLEEFLARYEEASRIAEQAAGDAAELLKEMQAKEDLTDEHRAKMAELSDKLNKAAAELDNLANREDLFPLDEELKPEVQELADAVGQAGQDAAAGAAAADHAQALEAMQFAVASLKREQDEYDEEVMNPLRQFEEVYALKAMEERFIELAKAQEGLALRSSNLNKMDDTDDPALRVRMRDLRDEEAELNSQLQETLQEIRRRAWQIPGDSTEIVALRYSAEEFVKNVRGSRALPAMEEADAALNEFKGTEASERTREAADVLNSFIETCEAMGNSPSMISGFSPKMMNAAQASLKAMLNAQSGNKNGYSMRGLSAMVGLYGRLPPQRANLSGNGNSTDTPGFSMEYSGRGAEGEIHPGEMKAVDSESQALRAVPTAYRDDVRNYFRRVADETAAGTVLDRPVEGD